MTAVDASTGEPETESLSVDERNRLCALARAVSWIVLLSVPAGALSLTVALAGPLLLWIPDGRIGQWLPAVVGALTSGDPPAIALLGLGLLLLLGSGAMMWKISRRLTKRLDAGGAAIKHELRLLLLASLAPLLLSAFGMVLQIVIFSLAGLCSIIPLAAACLCAAALPSMVVRVLTQFRDVLDVTLARPFAPGSPADTEWREIQETW